MRPLILFLFLSAPAGAQLTCTAFVANQPILRQEGIAEAAGDILISCSGFPSNAQTGPQNLALTVTNAAITSRQLYTGTAPSSIPTEAALLIDDCVTTSGTSSSGGTCGPNTAPTQGYLENGALVFANFYLPTTGAPFQIRVTNIRVNANQLAPGSFVTANLATSVATQNATDLTLGVVQQSLLAVTGPAILTFANCQPQSTTIDNFTIAELVNSTFKSPAAITGPVGNFDNNTPGDWYQNGMNTESQTILPAIPPGWTNPLAGILPGEADEATRLRVNLTGIPQGVTVTLPVNLGTNVVLTSLSPASLPMGSASSLVTLFGTGFTEGMEVNFGDNSLTSVFVNSNQLQVVVPASYLSAQQIANVSVYGSNALPFTVGPSSVGNVLFTCTPPGGPSSAEAYFSQSCSTSGTAPFTWSATDLTSGLTLVPSSGSSVTIDGTPTATVGEGYSYSIQVTDSSSPQLSSAATFTGTLGTGPNVGQIAATSGGDLAPFSAFTGNGVPFTSSGSATYEVYAQVGSAVDSLTFPITIAGTGTFSPGNIYISGTYAPTSGETSTAIPRFMDTSSPSLLFSVQSCSGPAKLVFLSQPSSGLINSQLPAITVQVQDVNGNPITTTPVAVTLTSAPAGISVTVNTVNGVATFNNLEFTLAGTYRLTANSPSLTPAIGQTLAIGPQLVFTTPPADTTAGVTMPAIVVEVQDTNGHLLTSYGTSITLVSSPAGINVTAATINGVATFNNLVLTTSNVYTLTASSPGLASASNSFYIEPAAPAKLAFVTPPPASTTAGSYFSAGVQVQDTYGNTCFTALNSSPLITLTSTPAGVSQSAYYLDPQASFSNIILNSPGTYTLTASSAGLTSASVVITINPVKPVFITQPANTTAGSTLAPISVQLQDPAGNPVLTGALPVSLTSNPAGINTTQYAYTGVVTFSNLQLDSSGTYTLTATVSAGNTAPSTTSNPFTVAPGAATKLVFSTQPPTLTQTGTPIIVVVQLVDLYGNAATTSNAAITISSSPAGVSATVNTVSGQATFNNLIFNATGEYTLTASGAGLTSVTSNGIAVIPPSPAKLVFITQPTGGVAGTPIAPFSVEVQDANGNVSSQFYGLISVTSTPGAVTATPQPVNGIATLSGIDFTIPGTYYFTASYPGVTSAVSNTFTIASAAYTISGQVTFNGTALSGVTLSLTGGQTVTTSTDGSGNYAFTGLTGGGFYTLTPSKAGYLFNPPDASYSPLNGYAFTNFAATAAPPPNPFSQIGVFRNSLGGPSAGFVLDSSGTNNYAPANNKVLFFGLPGDMPVAGNFFGKGTIEVGVFRCPAPGQGVCQWYIDADNNGAWDSNDVIWSFGLPGDIPVVGDWTGDGTSKIGVFRCPASGASGVCTWILDAGNKHMYDAATAITASFGLTGDLPVVNAWAGGAVDGIGVFRGNGIWIVNIEGALTYSPFNSISLSYGVSGDRPVVGDWDGTGTKRIGIFRPSTGFWVLNVSGSDYWTPADPIGYFGLPGDLPVVGYWTQN